MPDDRVHLISKVGAVRWRDDAAFEPDRPRLAALTPARLRDVEAGRLAIVEQDRHGIWREKAAPAPSPPAPLPEGEGSKAVKRARGRGAK